MTWSIGASTGCCIEHRIVDVLGAVHSAGLCGVELGTPPNHFNPADRAALRDVSEQMRVLRLQPVSIHARFGDGLDLSAADPRERAAAVGRVAVAASALKHLGGSIVVVHPTDIPRRDTDVEGRLDRCIDSLNTVAALCQAMDLHLAVETPLPHLVGGSAQEFEQILRQLDESALVCLDTSHATLGHNWDRFVEMSGHRIAHVHANDHRGHDDDHLTPGDGIIDWHHIATTLRTVGFAGWIMLELTCATGSHATQLSRAHSRTMHVLQ